MLNICENKVCEHKYNFMLPRLVNSTIESVFRILSFVGIEEAKKMAFCNQL